jgi:hypothetical protein
LKQGTMFPCPFQPQDNSVLICKNSQIKPRKSEQV